MPIVSVIVPVYKVEPYLEQCVDSLLNQSLKEIEIILVDDGSPDRCGAICDRYASHDERVRVIHQENAGLSAARNAGIAEAAGEYLMFVDSDDWVEPDYCRIPYQIAREHDADLVIFQYKRIEKNKIKISHCDEQDGIKSRDKALWLLAHGVGAAAWNKLYHRSLLQSVQFPEGKLYEDVAVTHRIVHAAENIYYTNTVLYNYRARNGSITMLWTEKAADDYFEMTMQKVSDLEEWGYMELAEEMRQKASWAYLLRQGRSGKYSDECVAYYHNFKGYPALFSRRSKAAFSLYRISPVLFDIVCILWRKRVK